MKQTSIYLMSLVAVLAGSETSWGQPAWTQPSVASQPAVPPFADEIRRFVEWDRRNSFPRNAVLFVGSSSIRLWATRQSFPALPVINRGFGGSHIAHVNQHFAEVARPYNAKVIVLYAGDNDIASGKSAEQVRSDFAAFVRLVREQQPETPILFLSIKPSESRWEHWPRMRQANDLIRAHCEAHPHLTFLDVATPLLGSDGRPRPELYLADRLHLSEAGYRVWTDTVAPVVERLHAD